ncbi:hypothetical protein B0H21DRAFT_81141 [Amylocystis lapponica]|nr:hypothetical protein B0H21DRAFT_81141 [Amylocystis lapponica]
MLLRAQCPLPMCDCKHPNKVHGAIYLSLRCICHPCRCRSGTIGHRIAQAAWPARDVYSVVFWCPFAAGCSLLPAHDSLRGSAHARSRACSHRPVTPTSFGQASFVLIVRMSFGVEFLLVNLTWTLERFPFFFRLIMHSQSSIHFPLADGCFTNSVSTMLQFRLYNGKSSRQT